MANTKIERLLFRIGIELKSTFGEFILHSDFDLPRIGKMISQNYSFPLQTAKRGKTQRNMASIFRPELMYIKRLLQNTFKYRMQTIELHCRNQLKLPRDRNEETKENAQRSATAKALSCFSDY